MKSTDSSSDSIEKRQVTPLGLVEFVCLISLLSSLTAASIDALLPALLTMGEALKVANSNNLQLVITVFFAGMVFGELVFGPLSDALGRKASILIGLIIYLVGALIAITGGSLEQVLIGRLIQGVGVSGPKVATRALIRDLYVGDEMARIMSFMFTVMILVPMVSPAVGQWVLFVSNWQGIFVVLMIMALCSACWLAIRQPETLAVSDRIPIRVSSLLGNTRLILTNRLVIAPTLAVGLVFGSFLLYLSTSQAVFFDVYDIDTRFPLYFAFLSIPLGMAAWLNSRLVVRIGAKKISQVALFVFVLLSAAFLFGSVMTSGRPPLPLFLAGCFGVFACIGFLFGNLNAIAMQPLGAMAGIGSSIVASLSSIVAIALAIPLGRFYDQTLLVLNVGFLLSSIIALSLFLLCVKPSTPSA